MFFSTILQTTIEGFWVVCSYFQGNSEFSWKGRTVLAASLNTHKVYTYSYSPTEILNPAGIYLLRVNNRNTRTRCEICPKLTIKTQEQHQWTYFTPYSSVSIVNFEHVIATWEAMSAICSKLTKRSPRTTSICFFFRNR